MTSKTFVSGTVIDSAWLNDVDAVAYGIGQPSGASLVGYLPAGAGAVPSDIQSKLRESVSVTDKGASTALADNTLLIQAALDEAGVISFPDGEFITGPLTVRSNTTLIFSPGTVLKAKTGYGTYDCVLNLNGIQNVTIFGNWGTVQMLKAEYVSGEYRHCMSVQSCTNVTAYNLICKDSGGDGFYINGNQITLFDCIADNNRRNGLSIIAGNTINILGGHYKNTVGTNPQYGIDIEPNDPAQVLQNINLIGVTTSGNARGGISFVPKNSTNAVSITVSNYLSLNDSSLGAAGASAILFALDSATKIIGTIAVDNAVIQTPGNHGVWFFNWSTNDPRVKMRNVNVVNPGAASSVSNSNNCGFFTSSNALLSADEGNFELVDCSAIDYRAVPFMRVPFFIQTLNGNNIGNISIDNPTHSGQVATFATGVVFGNDNTATDVIVTRKLKSVVASASTLALDRSHWGATVTNTNQASHTVNLPTANTNIGYEIEFQLTQDGFIRIAPAAGDVILRYASDSVGISVVARKKGDYIRLRSVGGNAWTAIAVTGQWIAFVGSSLFSTDARISSGNNSAAPTTGTWVVGDIVYHSAPAASGFIGWVCTTAGTPGTWKTFGAIAA